MGPGRIIGDAFFGGTVMPTITETQDIGSSTLKWNNIYAKKFVGPLNGNADTATKATQDSDGNAINTTYLKVANGIQYFNNHDKNIDTLTTIPYIQTAQKEGGSWSGTKPSGSHNGVALFNFQTHTGNYYSQLALDTSQNRIWMRSANNASSYGTWSKVAYTSDIPTNLNQLTNGPGYVTSSGVTSITLKAGAGITLDTDNTAITSTGTRTISISGMNTSSGSTTKWLNEKGGWSTPTAANVGALASNTTITNVSFTGATDNAEYPILMKNSTGSTTTVAGVKFANISEKGVTINPSSGTISATGLNISPTAQMKFIISLDNPRQSRRLTEHNTNSYRHWIILLLPYQTTTNQSINNYISGRFHLKKSGANIYDEIYIDANLCYNALKYRLDTWGEGSFTPISCTYNGIKYFALKCYDHDNPWTQVWFDGYCISEYPGGNITSTKPLSLPYMVNYKGNGTSTGSTTIVNTEVNNSISTTLTDSIITSVTRYYPYTNINGNAATATKLTSTPNNTSTFLRGDNTWSNTLVGPLKIGAPDTAANTGYATANVGSQNYIAFYGVYGDNPGGYNHTYIGESIYGPKTTTNEQSELLLFKGNDMSGSGPDRIRLFAAEVDIQTYTSALSGTWDTIRATTGIQIANFKKEQVTITGNILPEANNTRTLGTSVLKWSTIYATTLDSSVLKLHQGNAVHPSTSSNARIEFDYTSGQPVHIAYTPNDGYRSPAGLKIMGNGLTSGEVSSPAWLEVEGAFYSTDLFVEKTRLNDNWLGFYSANNGSGNRLGYIQGSTDYMYFRKEQTNNGFNFNGNLVPEATGTRQVGTSDLRWKFYGSYLNISGESLFTGAATFNSTVTMNSSASIDSLTAGSLVVSGNSSLVNTANTATLLPHANNTYDVGSSSLKYANIYATKFNGEVTNVTTTADTTNSLYLVGVTSSATTTLKRDTSITMTGNTMNLYALWGTQMAMRHIDAGRNTVNSDHTLYIGYGAQTYTAKTTFWYSTGTTDSTSSRIQFAEINSNGLYALTRFGVAGQNTSYNFYVNGTSYLNGDTVATRLGVNGQDTNYNLYVNGTSYFNGNTVATRLGVNGQDTNYKLYVNGTSLYTGRLYGNTGHGLEVSSLNTGGWNEGIRVYNASNNFSVVCLCNSDLSDLLSLVHNGSNHSYYIDLVKSGTAYVLKFPQHTGTFALTDGYGATGTWGISISGNASATETALHARGILYNYGAQTVDATGWNNWVATNQFGIFTNWWDNSKTKMPYIYGSGIMIPHLDSNYRSFIYGSCNNSDMYYGYSSNGGQTTTWKRVWLQGDAVTNAVWNDLAECRKSDLREPGYAITPAGHHTTKRLEPGCRITSDTWGFALGNENDQDKMPVAISGRVLAYPARSREEYHLGDCVCSAPDGKVDIMTRQEIRDWPDCIIGIVNEIPDYEEWGSEQEDNVGRTKIKVNGRIWIDIK